MRYTIHLKGGRYVELRGMPTGYGYSDTPRRNFDDVMDLSVMMAGEASLEQIRYRTMFFRMSRDELRYRRLAT